MLRNVLIGVFRQCLPIEEDSLASEQVNLSVKRSRLWRHFTTFYLTVNVRLDTRFDLYAKWILQVGEGRNLEGVEGRELMWDDVLFHGDLVDEVYGKLFETSSTFIGPRLVNYLRSRCILAIHNKVCENYNEAIVERLPGDLMVSTSIDELVPESNTDHHRFNSEQLNAVDAPGFPPHKLKIKKNSVVMCLRNLNVKQGIVNGKRYLLTSVGTLRLHLTDLRYEASCVGQEAHSAALQGAEREPFRGNPKDSTYLSQIRGSTISLQVRPSSVSGPPLLRHDCEQKPG